MLETQDKLKFVGHRVPLETDEPTTLVEVYERVARVHQKRDTLNHKRDGGWQSISSDEMLARARRIALGLYWLGVRKDDRVALLSESRLEWVLADQGCIFAGAICVPIYPTLTPQQAAYIINDSGAQALFISTPAKFEEFEAVVSHCVRVENIIIFDPNGLNRPNCLSFAELEERGRKLESAQPGLADYLAHAAGPNDLAAIIYT